MSKQSRSPNDVPKKAERQDRSRVFVSYSRVDKDTALRIRDSLLKAGFDAFLDVRDIAPGEPWQERLGSLIASAEKVLFLISPDSVTSQICAWEIDQTERLAKTLLPVVVRTTFVEKIPGRLNRLNFIFLRDNAEWAANREALVEALTQDLAWEREKTRLGEFAADWDAAGRPARVLVDEDAIRSAEVWRDGRPTKRSSSAPCHPRFPAGMPTSARLARKTGAPASDASVRGFCGGVGDRQRFGLDAVQRMA